MQPGEKNPQRGRIDFKIPGFMVNMRLSHHDGECKGGYMHTRLFIIVLTVFANLFGLIGGAVVFLSLGFPIVTYSNQVLSAVTYGDFLGGLAKSFVFGILIAAIGCLSGLETKTGASAVGDSATRAVVSGIVLIIFTDGIFSVLFHILGI